MNLSLSVDLRFVEATDCDREGRVDLDFGLRKVPVVQRYRDVHKHRVDRLTRVDLKAVLVLVLDHSNGLPLRITFRNQVFIMFRREFEYYIIDVVEFVGVGVNFEPRPDCIMLDVRQFFPVLSGCHPVIEFVLRFEDWPVWQNLHAELHIIEHMSVVRNRVIFISLQGGDHTEVVVSRGSFRFVVRQFCDVHLVNILRIVCSVSFGVGVVLVLDVQILRAFAVRAGHVHALQSHHLVQRAVRLV